MQPDPFRSRARLHQWQASRRWIPHRHEHALDEAERIAEAGGAWLREAARATGNKAVLGCVDALADHARERRKVEE